MNKEITSVKNTSKEMKNEMEMPSLPTNQDSSSFNVSRPPTSTEKSKCHLNRKTSDTFSNPPSKRKKGSIKPASSLSISMYLHKNSEQTSKIEVANEVHNQKSKMESSVEKQNKPTSTFLDTAKSDLDKHSQRSSSLFFQRSVLEEDPDTILKLSNGPTKVSQMNAKRISEKGENNRNGNVYPIPPNNSSNMPLYGTRLNKSIVTALDTSKTEKDKNGKNGDKKTLKLKINYAKNSNWCTSSTIPNKKTIYEVNINKTPKKRYQEKKKKHNIDASKSNYKSTRKEKREKTVHSPLSDFLFDDVTRKADENATTNDNKRIFPKKSSKLQPATTKPLAVLYEKMNEQNESSDTYSDSEEMINFLLNINVKKKDRKKYKRKIKNGCEDASKLKNVVEMKSSVSNPILKKVKMINKRSKQKTPLLSDSSTNNIEKMETSESILLLEKPKLRSSKENCDASQNKSTCSNSPLMLSTSINSKKLTDDTIEINKEHQYIFGSSFKYPACNKVAKPSNSKIVLNTPKASAESKLHQLEENHKFRPVQKINKESDVNEILKLKNIQSAISKDRNTESSTDPLKEKESGRNEKRSPGRKRKNSDDKNCSYKTKMDQSNSNVYKNVNAELSQFSKKIGSTKEKENSQNKLYNLPKLSHPKDLHESTTVKEIFDNCKTLSSKTSLQPIEKVQSTIGDSVLSLSPHPFAKPLLERKYEAEETNDNSIYSSSHETRLKTMLLLKELCLNQDDVHKRIFYDVVDFLAEQDYPFPDNLEFNIDVSKLSLEECLKIQTFFIEYT